MTYFSFREKQEKKKKGKQSASALSLDCQTFWSNINVNVTCETGTDKCSSSFLWFNKKRSGFGVDQDKTNTCTIQFCSGPRKLSNDFF